MSVDRAVNAPVLDTVQDKLLHLGGFVVKPRGRVAAMAVVLSMMPTLGGCTVAAEPTPTYDEVRSQTRAAVSTVTALFPDGVDYVSRDELEPFGCGGDEAPLANVPEGTAFFTERGEAVVPEGFDANAFVLGLPDALGEDWTATEPRDGLPFVSFTMTYLPDHVDIAVNASTLEGETLINITARSQCGRLSAAQQ
ncbi:hypothetical protein [Microbacterium arborescens]|jgi:hypothetical protein|uniref:hypothetical protein n=1 Tax=Microbacterium TaxID=33882 RepID=UPI0025A01E6F|nr:hypothetical protein [Microbacterium arborescens]WJM14902.1 hypothetical protein QUC20_11520 [Microbacterium arborescens]